MNDIAEHKATTSPYELLAHLNDKILAGELLSFSQLRDYCASVPASPNLAAIMRRAFDLQRRLYWGFFRNMTSEAFWKLWSQVVLADGTWRFAGDLKRYMSIPDLYVGMLDLHGYTRFCRENRSNLSMLDLLDSLIQDVVPRIASSSGVLARRFSGDEILLLGASAGDVLDTTLAIMDYFSRSRRLADNAARGRLNYDSILPVFKLSAGISGGQKYTPLIITRDGDLSGDIVNTAARLQSRAGKLSQERNRILVTSHVRQRLKAEGEGSAHRGKVDFLDAGQVEFKGTTIPVWDAVFLDTEAWRLSCLDALEALYGSIDKGQWKAKVFEDSIALAEKAASSIPSVSPRRKTAGRDIDRARLLGLAKEAREHFAEERFEKAVECLVALVADLGEVKGMDDVVLEYLEGASANYAECVHAFVSALDREIADRIEDWLPPKERANYRMLGTHYEAFAAVREAARLQGRNRKAIWQRVADDAAPSLQVVIRSSK